MQLCGWPEPAAAVAVAAVAAAGTFVATTRADDDEDDTDDDAAATAAAAADDDDDDDDDDDFLPSVNAAGADVAGAAGSADEPMVGFACDGDGTDSVHALRSMCAGGDVGELPPELGPPLVHSMDSSVSLLLSVVVSPALIASAGGCLCSVPV